MASSLRALAAAVDGFGAQGLATITESPGALTIAGVNSAEALVLVPLLSAVAWPLQVTDGAGEVADPAALSADYEPFIFTLDKPLVDDALPVLTLAGLHAFLLEERADAVWQVVPLTTAFASMASDFRPWGTIEIFSPAPATKTPRELVWENNLPPHAPADVRVWMPRGPASPEQWGDLAFQTFADLSAQALMRALAGEIKRDGSLLYKGPPYTQLDAPRNGAANELGREGYNDLRDAAAWVYENGVEAERRHGLFTAELGATHPPIATAALAFRRVVVGVLQGARLAYQLSLSDLTREAIKAQGDLRKAVADDTAKLADNTRQVATAVAAALATCVGLIAAKVGTTTPHWVLQVVALIAAVYVGAIIASGCIFMSVQQDMRKKWRARLYRFVPDPDYKAMVLDPAGRAESMFVLSAVAGGLVAALAVLVVLFLR
jgi:hypothetical protein